MISPSNQITIGLLAGATNDPSAKILVNEILPVTKSLNVRLVMYAFDHFHTGITRHDGGDVITDIVDSHSIDALIVFGYLSHNVSEKVLQAFCEQFRPIPLVTLAIKVPGFPCVINDDRIGMRELMVHLLDKHHYERIAFIGGPVGQQEAELRKEVFISEMEKRGLPVRDEWIVHGDFTYQSGAQAMAKLIGNGMPSFQGVVVANDTMALAAEQFLESKGYRVPRDLFLTGFDNIHSQSLTTVSQSMLLLLQEAVQKVRQILGGETVPEQTVIPSFLVVRTSCGCTAFDRQAYESRTLLSLDKVMPWQTKLVDAFLLSSKNPKNGTFLNELQSLLDDNTVVDSDQLCQILLTKLRRRRQSVFVTNVLDNAEERLLDRGCLLVSEDMLRRETKGRYKAEIRNEQLRAISEPLGNSTSIPEVMDILARDLPEMGFKACWLSLFDTPQKNDRNPCLRLAFDQSGRRVLPPGGVHFPPHELRPGGIRSSGLDDWLMIVEILHFKQDILGFVLFSPSVEGTLVCDALRSQISSSIAGARLWEEYKHTESQLVQSEKLASIGQLAAGVAHEINNPIGFVNSNLGTLKNYVEDLMQVIEIYECGRNLLMADPDLHKRIKDVCEKADLDFLREDIGKLIAESIDGTGRVRRIVQDLRDFSRIDSAEWQWADLHAGLESTLNVVWNEIKYKADIVREFGTIPLVQCRLAQLNQVFMNMLVNAGQAIPKHGTITLRSGCADDKVWISISDTGEGIPQALMTKIFDPFFTTKPIGKGTGLGLSVSYGIVDKHGGYIDVQSNPGQGTTFTIWLPVQQFDQRQPDN